MSRQHRIYLASPYTHKSPCARVDRYELAKMACAKIIACGHLAFSPIVHSHPLAEHGLQIDFNFWESWCLSFISDWATKLLVLPLPGWEKSKGIRHEMKFARQIDVPVEIWKDWKRHLSEPDDKLRELL